MRPRFTSLSFLAKILVKPRLGSRRWSGIWPPSKPLMRTPERAVWPLPPRPAVLPEPEPMPRPRRCRVLLDPGRSASSLSFIGLLLNLFPSSWPDSSRPSTSFARPKDVDARHKAGHDAVLCLEHAHDVLDL